MSDERFQGTLLWGCLCHWPYRYQIQCFPKHNDQVQYANQNVKISIFFCFRFAVNAVNGTLQWRRNCKPQLEAQLGCTEHEAFHGLFKVDECLCNTSECNENMGTIGTTSTSTITSSTTTSIKTSTSTSTAKTSSSTSTAKTSSTTSLTETTTGSTTTGE